MPNFRITTFNVTGLGLCFKKNYTEGSFVVSNAVRRTTRYNFIFAGLNILRFIKYFRN